MATIGLKLVKWAPLATEPASAVPTYTAASAVVLGKAVSASVTINNAEASLYADDALAEYVAEFADGDLTMEVDNISVENQSTLYGATYDDDDDEMAFGTEDTAPYGGIGGYQTLMVGGVRKYRSYFFPKVKAAIPNWTGTTKGSSISFGTEPIDMKILAPTYGPYRYVAEHSTESDAKAWVDAKLGITSGGGGGGGEGGGGASG